jgi:AcrR family transcriptional regulator
MQCFAAKGFSGTTTRELAARAGLTEAALYRHFPSKEALYAAIVDHKMAAAPVTAALEDAARRCDDEAVFRGLARALLERGLEDPAFLRILLFTSLEGHELSAPFVAARLTRLREFLTSYISRRIEDGAFAGFEPALAAHAFLGMVFDHLLARIVFRLDALYPHPVDEVVESFVALFLEGIRRR